MTIPETLEEALSPQWLSQALGQRYRGIEVTKAVPGPVVQRVSTNARVAVEYAGDPPEGLSKYLCVKGYFGDYGRLAAPAGEPEVRFYRDLAEWSGVPTLECVYAEIEPETHHGVVITEDVAEGGATFLDALSPYTADQAAASLEIYAGMHGRTWDAGQLRQGWLDIKLANTLRGRGLREIGGNFDGPIGAGVPDEARDAERLVRVVTGLASVVPKLGPVSLLQGDAHIGNVYLDADNVPFLLDWQLVQRGPWYIDTGYHIGCTLPVEERRREEQRLVSHYLEHLEKSGGKAPTAAGVEDGICVGLVYGFFLWAITLKVRPPVTTAMLDRLGAAVADHDALTVCERVIAGGGPRP